MALLLHCQSLSRTFGARPLFQNITLSLSDGQRVGLIGPNGSGKSTLLRTLAGLDAPDDGEVTSRRGLRVVLIEQQDRFPAGFSVLQVMEEALQNQPLEEYERTERIAAALGRLGFERDDQNVETLSGGWRKRLALARAFAQKPDVVLLDEPTNHLDLATILKLETILQEASFALMMVSHDRAFLQKVVNSMVELDRIYPEGFLRSEGDYSDFLEAREAFLAAQAHRQHALEGQVKREVEWLRRSAPARTTKAEARIQQAHKLMDTLADTRDRNSQAGRTADIAFGASGRKTKELAAGKGLSKSLGDRTLFSEVEFTLSPGTRLGLLGPNGSGKTTLLRLISGELEPDTGEIRHANGLKMVYFTQDRALEDPSLSLRRALCPEGDTVHYRGSALHISAWARRFLFRTEQLEQPLSSLSGGEQARVKIANLMLQNADLLILDEPTNDLDIASIEALEESLQDFPGALVLVTHDRYMLDRQSSLLLALDGRGGTAWFADYAQWERTQAEEEEAPVKKSAASIAPPAAPARLRRLSTLEQKELAGMEEIIMAAETEVEELQKKMGDPDVAADFRKTQETWAAVQAAQQKVERLYTRWEELESRKQQ